MTRCHICDADAPDAHEPILCGSCCDDRVARIIEDLARLDVTAAAVEDREGRVVSARSVVAMLGYLGCIVGANWALRTWGIVDYGWLVLPAGTWFAGLSFGFRDAVQEAAGRVPVLIIIVAGSVLSWFIEPTFALASGAAFLVSELADFAVYTPLRERQWTVAVVASNVVGSVVDSLLFLWLAFDSVGGWFDLTIGKALMVVPAIPLVWWARGRATRIRPAHVLAREHALEREAR